jgi:Kef-type K+ transport system membrane component KefB
MPLAVLASVLLLIIAFRPLLNWLLASYRSNGELSETMLGFVALLVLASALFTEWAGVHLFLGGFLAGLIMPRDRQFRSYLLARFETAAVTLLLPVFFAVTGLRTSMGMIRGGEMWACCLLIVVVATLGKCGASWAAAVVAGMSREDAGSLSILLNTRGLMELIILNIGLEMRIISSALFSMLVFMALFTTFSTAPILDWISHRRSRQIASSQELLSCVVQSGQ